MTAPLHDIEITYEDGHVSFTHTCIDGERLTATLPNGPWTITSIHPLTVRPSIGCDRCRLHGWITGGAFWGTRVEEA